MTTGVALLNNKVARNTAKIVFRALNERAVVRIAQRTGDPFQFQYDFGPRRKTLLVGVSGLGLVQLI